MSSTVFVEIRMVKDTPAIVGTDMNRYGPFVKDRVYAVPKENARSFLKLGLAVATRKEAEKPTLKEMFKGEVLNGYVEAAKVKLLGSSNPEFHWRDWSTWKTLLWDKWVKTAGENKVKMKLIELVNLQRWFLRACDLAGLDPDEVDVASYVHYWTSYDDAKRALDEFVKTPPSEAEYKAMYEEYKRGLEEEVREKFPEAFADLDKQIVKLERETASLPRLERERERYKRMSEELQYQLEETKRRVKEERSAFERKLAAIKLRVLKPFSEGIIDYTVGSVIETRDLDWAMDKVEKGYGERVPLEVPVKRVPPPAVAPPEVKPPKVKVLPPFPEKCPVCGAPLKEMTRVPLLIKDPLRLTSEEEYFRAAAGIPLPTVTVEMIDVPATMKVWVCRNDHYFERDAAGRPVQRTPEYLYRKIIRETAKLRKLRPPELVPRPVYVPFKPPLIKLKPPAASPKRWLLETKGLTWGEFLRLPDEKRKALLEEYVRLSRERT